jgi:sugar phosphate isomerase/epimerase
MAKKTATKKKTAAKKKPVISDTPVTVGGFKLCLTSAVAPQWSVQQLVDAAVKYGYAGVELSSGAGGSHGLELDSTETALKEAREIFSDNGIGIACLGTPVSFHAADAKERQKALEELERYIEVADILATPFVRIFGGEIPSGIEVAGAADYISDCLAEAANFVEQHQATLLVETFGTFRNSRFLREIIKQVYSPRLQALWNVPETVRGLEPVVDTYDSLCDHIRHVHLADYEYFEERTAVAPAEFGDGFVPLKQAINVLADGGYRGYLAFDPAEIPEDPDEELQSAVNVLKGVLGEE